MPPAVVAAPEVVMVDGVASEIPVGGDLQKEFMDALDDKQFSFKGTFYHASILSSALNPCLCVSGLGMIGLPLSERDAKAIIKCSKLAPFGKGKRTVVDKGVRNTWEIDPSRISFANTEWEKYVNNTLCIELCKTLGVAVGKNLPRMELYKLLLYEKGSHFLPHQDTQKADGMFATVIILLPSAYTGGQVVVSHASNTQTIDFSQNSLLSTALLAWYTDVQHSVKPVTSGYRLALSYNLIHSAPSDIPPPCLPDMRDSTVALRRVFMKWKHNKYPGRTEQNLIAYLLKHQYSNINMINGLKELKGVDLHRVSYIRPIAEEMGFRVGLAALEHNRSGYAEDTGCDYYRRRRYYDYDSDPELDTPEMGEVSEISTKISDLVDLNGVRLLFLGKLEIDDTCLVPKNPFENANPDDTEYEGYMGNFAGQLDHWYRRTVLVLINEDKVDDLCYSAEGVTYAFRKLKQSSAIPPTAADRRWANRILEKSTSDLKGDQVAVLLDYALKWKDLDLWKNVVKQPVCTLTLADKNLFINAWDIASFKDVQSSYELLLAHSTSFSERIDLVLLLKSHTSPAEKSNVDAWCKSELDKILSSFTSAKAQDISSILTVIRVLGLSFLETPLMPNFKKQTNNYAFWMALLKALTEQKSVIIEQEIKRLTERPNADSSMQLLETGISTRIDALIKECLKSATSQWSAGIIPTLLASHTHMFHYMSNSTNTATVQRIVEIVEQAITISDFGICRKLFVKIIKSPAADAAAKTKFQDLYEPLIPRLRDLLSSKNQDISKSPFSDFLHVVIGLYMRDVLGKKEEMPRAGLRKIGCGCADCVQLDKFILNPTTTTTEFRLVQDRRSHLESRLIRARDLCTFLTIKSGSPHCLQVSKLPTVISASTWTMRRNAAKAFLALVGPNTVLPKIMGTQYQDLVNAFNGSQHFSNVPTLSAGPSASAGRVAAATGSSTAGPSLSHPTTAAASSHQSAPSRSSATALQNVSTGTAPPAQVTGQKRKL